MQVFFFFKQKTAYEMRISDWSSDVCSSDLHLLPYVVLVGLLAGVVIDTATNIESVRLGVVLGWPAVVVVAIGWREKIGRASCGKECVSTCRSRGSPDH